MSRISNVVQVQNVKRLQFPHVLIPYLNRYIKADTLGLVSSILHPLFAVHALGKLCICAESSELCLLIDALTSDILSILQAIQNNSASSMFSIESISDFILFLKELVNDIAN